MDRNHIVFIVMDSCRHDSFVAARTPNIDRLGPAEKRYSYASWTAPSHYAFTMGMMPHASPSKVFASEVYKEEFMHWKDRIGAPRCFQRFPARIITAQGIEQARLSHCRQGVDAGAEQVHFDQSTFR